MTIEDGPNDTTWLGASMLTNNPITGFRYSPAERAEHPNYWSDHHPEGCPTCRVCPSCFRPRRPTQYGRNDDRCVNCIAEGS